ncbi:molybdopterin dinucleotide binding domain-containing protein [Thermocatellispora tengchongensis]|uniref:molybdopterin dinucleotide binding domain-containing protein n=1 Tax=Thermocatellispora tengchongensis TaxID=1073253 RepID=UPI00362531B2
MLAAPHGLAFAVDAPGDALRRIGTPDRRIHLALPDLLGSLRDLARGPDAADPDFPLVLSAGERRTSTANTLYRDPAWRRRDTEGALRVSPEDAAAFGLTPGRRARITTRRGSVEATVEVSATLSPGHISLPNGLGLGYPDDRGEELVTGAPPNELTSSAHRDPYAGTPLHKHIPARVEAVS